MKTIIATITLCFLMLFSFAQTQMKSQLNGVLHENDFKYINTYVIPGNTNILVNTESIYDSLYFCVQYTGTVFYRVPQGNINNASVLTNRSALFLSCPQTIYRETHNNTIIPPNTLVPTTAFYNNYYTVEYLGQTGYIFCLDISAVYFNDPITVDGWMSYAFIKNIKQPFCTPIFAEFCLDTTIFKQIPFKYERRHIHVYLEDSFGNITLQIIHLTE